MSDEQTRLMILKHEGLRLMPYKDSVGKLTIGVGRCIEDIGISRDEAMYLFNNDIAKASMGLAHMFHWYLSLDEVRQAVLVDMAFNLGIAGLAKFVMTIDYIRRGKYADAADEMMRSKWAMQVKGRAAELSEMMRTGKWQT